MNQPRLARRDRPTGTRCAKPLVGIEGEPRCDTPLTRIEVFIPGTVVAGVCPRCDVVDL